MKRVLFLILLLSLAAPAYAQEPTRVPDATRRSPPGDAGPAPVTYVVQPGDTLYRIAQDYGTTVEAIAAANDIADPAQITAGQKLIIPIAPVAAEPPAPPTSPNRRVHPVRPGETLPSLAFRYGTTVLTLRELNGLHRLGLLVTGQELLVPPPAVPTFEDRRFPPISIRPAPAVRGQTVFVSVQSDDRLDLSGSLSDQPLSFVREGRAVLGAARPGCLDAARRLPAGPVGRRSVLPATGLRCRKP